MRTRKTYRSPSVMAINVMLGSKNRQVNFDPSAVGGSTFSTDDERLQKAIERHYCFGSRIFLARAEAIESSEEPQESPKQPGSPNYPASPAIAPTFEAPEQVTVTDIDSAKEYLKNRFNIRASQLKTTAAVLECASEHGIEFVGI